MDEVMWMLQARYYGLRYVDAITEWGGAEWVGWA